MGLGKREKGVKEGMNDSAEPLNFYLDLSFSDYLLYSFIFDFLFAFYFLFVTPVINIVGYRDICIE